MAWSIIYAFGNTQPFRIVPLCYKIVGYQIVSYQIVGYQIVSYQIAGYQIVSYQIVG